MIKKAIHISKVALFENATILVIILIGAILRLWNYNNIPFMHDELSAMSRLQFDNFNDLIKYGVVLGDTHPAGVQVFLYLWTTLFGFSEIAVKLPFIFAGIISVWLSYLISKLWFNGTVGILTATYVSSLQFFVMYSQIARPYISGLFITLLMVYMWSLYFYKNKKTKYLILYVLFSALAAYNHHFSLLFAAIVGISGVFLIKKKDLIPYLISGVSIFVLYIPHLSIFFSQLAYGGIGGWLSEPTPEFFFRFINYIFHMSILNWIVVVAVILSLFIAKGAVISNSHIKQKRYLLIVWFILPIIIGYAYSVLRNPIIQYSMLIFSTPYLFILLFSFNKKISNRHILAMVIIIMVTNIITLIYNREHYNIFYRQPYQETISTALTVDNANDVFLIDGCLPYYNEYYFNKYKKSVPYFTFKDNEISLSGFDSLVSSITESTVVAAAITGEQRQIIQSHFPFQTGYKHGFTYEVYSFSKKMPPNGDNINREIIAQTNFENHIGNWKDVSDLVEYDSVNNESYCVLPISHEWGPSVSFDLHKIAPVGLGILDIELEIMMPDTVAKCSVVSSITNDDEVLSWDALNFEVYNLEKNKWKKIYYSVDIQLALKGLKNTENLKLKINVWNITKNKLKIKYIDIYKNPGNPIRYSLYYEIYPKK